MKKLYDNSVEKARKKFYLSLIMLVMAVIYLVSPVDLIPGPPPFEWIEDIPLLLASVIYAGYSYRKMKKESAR